MLIPPAPPIGAESKVGGGSSVLVTIEGDCILPFIWIDHAVHLYLSQPVTLDMPVPAPGQMVLLQNATSSALGFSLTVRSTNLWTGLNKVLASNDFVMYRAMDKDGAWLWREV